MAVLDLEEEQTPLFQRILPQELWEEILQRLQSTLDIVRSRSICNSWRSIIPSPLSTPIIPLSIPRPPTVKGRRGSFPHCPPVFFITESNGYLYRSPSCSEKNPVIVVFERTVPSGLFYPSLLYPPSGKRDRIKNFPKVLDLRECWICPLFTAYNVTMYNVLQEERITSIDKVVLISYDKITNKSILCNPVYSRIRPKVDLCAVVLTSTGKLYFLSTQSMNWETIKWDNTTDSKFDDIINYGGKLWAIDEIGGGYVLDDVKSLVLTQVVGSLPNKERPLYTGEISKRRLVEASGELYMLSKTRTIRRMKMRIEVYKVKRREWVNAKGVGDHIFYVMKGLCFSAVAGQELCSTNKDKSIEKGNILFVDNRSFGGEYNSFNSLHDKYSRRLQQLIDRRKSDVAYGLLHRGFAVYDFGKRTRVVLSDELPEMFCSEFLIRKSSRKCKRVCESDVDEESE